MSADTPPANAQLIHATSVNSQASAWAYATHAVEDLEAYVERLENDLARLGECHNALATTLATTMEATRAHQYRHLDIHRAQLNRLLKAHNRLRRTVNHNSDTYNNTHRMEHRTNARAAFFRERDAARRRMCQAAGFPWSECGSALELAYMTRGNRQAQHGRLP